MTFIRLAAVLAVTLVLSACVTPESPRMVALEKRVQQLQDERAIREVIIRYGDNKPVPSLAGRYVDEFVRENGTWKIKSRATHGVIPYR